MGATEPPRPGIVAGIDGSPSSLAALEWAARQADLTGSALVVVAAWRLPSTYPETGTFDDYDPAAEMQRVLDNSLPAIHRSHPTLELTGQVIEGHPGPVLVDASRDADLLVVGSRGHGEFADILLGSVGVHCATHAHCPVLVHRFDRAQAVTAATSAAREPATS
ncbi:MAG TPA: universal stress protein [Solirubrobacteraceae bacterium]|jgi:nucleotide-binding universal stress UspA family protein|nr:universal stress protein [Solirubrobacteraceae bacterium]